jgi:hypothetical protein
MGRSLARAITPHRYAGMPVPAIPRSAYSPNLTSGCPDQMSFAHLPNCANWSRTSERENSVSVIVLLMQSQP